MKRANDMLKKSATELCSGKPKITIFGFAGLLPRQISHAKNWIIDLIK
jgi:hypothetical protein